MHLIEEHPTKREGIERRGSLRGDGACAGPHLSLPLEFRSHLHHQSLKHPAQRADAGGQVKSERLMPLRSGPCMSSLSPYVAVLRASLGFETVIFVSLFCRSLNGQE